MKFYENPDRWSMQVPLTAQTLNVTRQDRHFRVDVNGENKPLADLYLIPAHRDQVQVRREAYLEDHSEALALYPRVRELIDYRVRVTVAIAALLLAQAVVGILVFLKRRQKATLAFLTLSVGWAALWLWLAQVYLPA